VKSRTYVYTPSGATKIENVQVEDHVWSSTGWKKVLKVFDNGVRDIHRVTTDRGSILEGTGKHRVRVLKDGQLDWKTIGELTAQDYVVGTFGQSEWPSQNPSLPPLEIGPWEKPYGECSILIDPPTEVTKDFAYLLGAWDGDGKVDPDGIGWTGNRKEITLRIKIMDTFKRTFNHPLGLTQSPSREGSFDLRKCSAPIKRWFEKIAGGRGLTVPEVILRSPRDKVCSYLQGLFDTDGWISKPGGNIGIKMKGVCEPFLRQVQMLLTALGIDSTLSLGFSYLKATNKFYSKVNLSIRSRIGRERFQTDIGFTEPAKRELLAKFVTKMKDSWHSKDAQVYPILQTYLVAQKQVHPTGSLCRNKPIPVYRVSKGVLKSGLVPRGTIEAVVKYAVEHNIESEELSFLRKILDLQVMRVVSVKATGKAEAVMDLEVEGDHEYQTGPILSHNSADIVTTTWIDDDLKKMNRVQFQCLKSRDQKPFERFEARVEWSCRRILTCMDVSLKPTPAPAGGGRGSKEAIEKAGSVLD